MGKLIVSEQFLSIQGEGLTVGTPAYFIRLKSCNLLCGGKGTDKDQQLHDGAKWRCDTIEVWLKGLEKTFEEVIQDFEGPVFLDRLEHMTHHLIFTGGEPMLHVKHIEDFIQHVSRKIHMVPTIEIETNGTIEPTERLSDLVLFNVSPKLSNSGMPESKRMNETAIRMLNECETSIFKFVIADHKDLMEAIKYWILPFDLDPDKIYLMPAGDSREQLEQVSDFVARSCAQEGYKFSPRLHINIWNKKTGV
jgi:7-carboxy-7-deazaguanine synthase